MNYPQHEGEQLKLKLRESGLSMGWVAAKLHISRQSLYMHLQREKLNKDFYNYVNKTLNITIENISSQNEEIIPPAEKSETTSFNKETAFLQAQMKTVLRATAKLMARSSGRDVLECLEELELDAKLCYKEMFPAS